MKGDVIPGVAHSRASFFRCHQTAGLASLQAEDRGCSVPNQGIWRVPVEQRRDAHLLPLDPHLEVREGCPLPGLLL
ncbi:MAG: hypothetical protein ACK559_14065, partial [bacterium]